MGNFKCYFFVVFMLLCNGIMAQLPVAKVDINMEGRNASEVNQEGYTPWYMARVPSASITVSGVTFELRATSPKDHAAFRTSWAKALVQSPNYMRLVGDGVKVDNDSLTKFPGMPAAFEMRITGLPKGVHSLQTYHNIWEDTTKVNHAPMNVYLNNSLLFSKVKRTVKVLNVSEATLLNIELNVAEANQEMVLRFEADTSFVATVGKTRDLNVLINAFELNTSDASKQAREPLPAHGDLHVDADNGHYILQWKAATNNFTKTHTLYFGTDSATVANALENNASVCKGVFPVGSTSWKAENLYNIDTYYWRVDETDSLGKTSKGKIWQFKIRHDAFPGAEGYGRYAIGGRGGKVVYVTNLNDGGEGSFRYAVENIEGPRTILFAVSGLIDLTSRLVINDDFVTVAGQTAPGKGVCFRWAPIGVVGDDLIVQHLRVRLGIGVTFDGMGLTGADNSIIDHSSISWTIDESFSSRGAHNITLQRTLISEALNAAGHSNYTDGKQHGFAGSVGGDIGSLHHNLLAHCKGRNWSLAGGLDGDGFYAGKMDIFNTVVYNYGGRTTDGGAHKVNFVNNYYKMGAASEDINILTAQLEGLGKGSQAYYFSGNIKQTPNGTFKCDGTDNTCSRAYQKAATQVLDWEVFVNTPFFKSLAKIETAKEAYKSVLSDVGCTQPMIDDHDKRVINETLSGTTSCKGRRTGLAGLPDHEGDVGAWETYPGFNRARNWDSDLDGLPDWWEKTKGLNPNSAKGDFNDSNADDDKNGYTNIEEYLHWMSEPHYFIKKGEKLEVDLSRYTKGFTNKPVFTTSDAKNGSVTLSAGTSKVTFTSSKEGLAGFSFTVTDAEGTQMAQTVNIYVGEVPADVAFSYTYYLDRNNTTLITVDKASSSKKYAESTLKSQVEVYPNPTASQLNLKFQAQGSGQGKISISNLLGQTRMQQKIVTSTGANQVQIDVSTLAKGVYVLTIKNESGSRSARFIKQ